VARTRTTKKLAQRIDLNYFKRPTPLKRAKFWLSVLLPLLALVWIAWRGLSRDDRVYSSGRMSNAHAVLEKECAACHSREAGQFSAKVTDSACLACHDGPAHHSNAKKSLTCGTCHSEHRGRINISAVSNQACAECHADLDSPLRGSSIANHIRSLENGHPDFSESDPRGVKLNHAIHMQPIRRGPAGTLVQLQCADCHRPRTFKAEWKYSDARYASARSGSRDSARALGIDGYPPLVPPRPATGRELMEPPRFANACAACHLLTFDERFEVGVPHDDPPVIHDFLLKKFADYILAHPSELREKREPDRRLSGKPLPPEVRMLTPAQWVSEHTSKSEDLLWRKTCNECHTLACRDVLFHPVPITEMPYLKTAPNEICSPKYSWLVVLGSESVSQWMPHAKFDHGAHEGFTCVGCHAKALTSTESSAALLPGIETCKTCHAPGPEHAESRCFECHTYHDWSKRKEVTPKFTLPALRTGGR
jgi:hypothetical protein